MGVITGIIVFGFIAGFYAGYRWGHWDGRIEEVGHQFDNHEATERREMDMYHLYSQKEKELRAELDYYKRLAKETPCSG